MKKTKLVAFIPARRNSKGIVFKNRQKISGLSLVEHAFNVASQCNFDQIIISTDDEYFLEHDNLSKYCEYRGKNTSGDDATVSDIIREYSNDQSRKNDFFVIMEPTCFIRNKHHLDFLFNDDFFQTKKRSFASFVEAPVVREKIWDYKSGRMISGPIVWRRRQEYDRQYVLSGHYYGLYLSEINNFYPGLCDENVYPIIIDGVHIDIDSQLDLDVARILIEKSGETINP